MLLQKIIKPKAIKVCKIFKTRKKICNLNEKEKKSTVGVNHAYNIIRKIIKT